MMHLRGLVLLLLFPRGGARRSIRIDDSHHGAQQHYNTLADGVKESAESWETLIPRGFGIGLSRRADLRAGALREGWKQDGRHAAHVEPHRAAPWFRFGPPRAKVALREEEEEDGGGGGGEGGGGGGSVGATSGKELPAALAKTVKQFASVPNDKFRYQQLLFLANKVPPMDPSLMVDANRVRGCQSTVFIDATCEGDRIYFTGTSDAQLTKGLCSILVNGLSGSTNEEIQRVPPEFIKQMKISQSLSPGRNNGFLNMLATMKRKAAEACEK